MSRKATAGRTTNRRVTRSAWEDQTVTYNPDAPSVQKAAKSEKWKRRALYAVTFGAVPVMAICGAGMFAQANAETPGADLAAASAVTNGSGGKAEAYRAVEEWLVSSPSPLPGGKVVSWDGYTVQEPPAPDPNDASAKVYEFSFETHTFTLQRGENMWRAQVEVAVDDIVGATATSTPALTPIPRVDQVANTDWFDLEPATPTTAVTQAIEAWAAAYTGGDPDALHQIVQDRNADRSYLPLSGVQELISVRTTNSAAYPSPEEDSATEATQQSKIIVRVELSFWWDGGKPVLGPNEQEKVPAPVTYDLLVEHADTATPVVVAWGAAGTGPKLKAYQNAIDVVLEKPSSKPSDGTGTTGDETVIPAPEDSADPAAPADGDPASTDGDDEGWDY